MSKGSGSRRQSAQRTEVAPPDGVSDVAGEAVTSSGIGKARGEVNDAAVCRDVGVSGASGIREAVGQCNLRRKLGAAAGD